jgi:hypothetical protein
VLRLEEVDRPFEDRVLLRPEFDRVRELERAPGDEPLLDDFFALELPPEVRLRVCCAI